jgi:hypothetical protein
MERRGRRNCNRFQVGYTTRQDASEANLLASMDCTGYCELRSRVWTHFVHVNVCVCMYAC